MRTVLYVEDHAQNRRLVQRVAELAAPGVLLLTAETGRAGVELARHARVDLVLLDLSLPDMTGEEVLAALREIPTFEGTRVVALTADATATRERHLRSLGVDGYLVKPFGLPELTDLLRG